MDVKFKGSYEGWNDKWVKQSEKKLLNPHYTESDPKNIFQFWQKAYATDLLNLIKDKNYTTFCELGSGRGTTSMYLSKAGHRDITMVDLAEAGFKVAEYSFNYYGLTVPNLLIRDVEETGLSNGSFDCIYNVGLLEHFKDPKFVLSESFRLLKSEGMIFMPIVPVQPLYKSLFTRLIFNPVSILKEVKRNIVHQNSPVGKISRTNYRPRFYIDICNEIGFRNIKCISYNPYWKVNSNGWVETNITLPLYKQHYNLFKNRKEMTFQTSNLFDLCHLLVAEK